MDRRALPDYTNIGGPQISQILVINLFPDPTKISTIPIGLLGVPDPAIIPTILVGLPDLTKTSIIPIGLLGVPDLTNIPIDLLGIKTTKNGCKILYTHSL